MRAFWYFCCIVVAMLAPVRATTIYPVGLGPRDGAAIVFGVPPASSADACCPIGARAVFRAEQPAGTDTLIVEVFVPSGALAGGERQAISTSVDGSTPRRYCCFGAGPNRIEISLQRSTRQRLRTIYVRLAYANPAGGERLEPPPAGVLLRAASFVDASALRAAERGAPVSPFPPWITLGLLLAAGIFAFLCSWRRPALGVAALIAADPFALTFGVHGTTLTLFKVTLLAVASATAFRSVRTARYGGAFRTIALPLAAFVATAALSIAPASDRSAAFRETFKDLEFALAFLVAYVAYRADPDEGIARIALGCTTIVVALAALAQVAIGTPESATYFGHTFARIAGPLEGPNQLAAYLGIVGPLGLCAALWLGWSWWERIALPLAALATLLTLSRAGIVSLAFGCAIGLLLYYRPEARQTAIYALAGLFAVLMGATLAAAAGALPGAERLFGSRTVYDTGLGTRAILWNGAFHMWRAHPIFGIGAGNFQDAIGRYAPGVRTHANSFYLNTLAERGLIGFATLIWLTIATIAAFSRSASRWPVVAALAIAFALTFHHLVDALAIYPKVGAMWWIALALGAASRDDEAGLTTSRASRPSAQRRS